MGTRSRDKFPLLSRRARVLCRQRWASLHYCSSGRTWWTPTSIWLWFGEVGFRGVWVTVLLTRVVIFIAVALVVGGTVFLGTIYLSHRR